MDEWEILSRDEEDEIWIITGNSLSKLYPSHIVRGFSDFGDVFTNYICSTEPVEEFELAVGKEEPVGFILVPTASALTKSSDVVRRFYGKTDKSFIRE